MFAKTREILIASLDQKLERLHEMCGKYPAISEFVGYYQHALEKPYTYMERTEEAKIYSQLVMLVYGITKTGGGGGDWTDHLLHVAGNWFLDDSSFLLKRKEGRHFGTWEAYDDPEQSGCSNPMILIEAAKENAKHYHRMDTDENYWDTDMVSSGKVEEMMMKEKHNLSGNSK